MRKFIVAVVFALCLVATFDSIEAKRQRGSLTTNDEWAFMAKFCFDTEGLGNLTWTIWADNTANMYLLFYDDVSDSWPYVWGHRGSLSCVQKRELAKGNASVITDVTRIEEFKDNTRPHYWYVAISNCGGGKIDLDYDFEFINAGGSWTRQFSYDEQGLAQMYLVYWLIFTFGLLIHLRGVWLLSRAGAFHPIVRLLSTTIALETTSIFFMFIHYAVYKDNGIGAPGLKGFAEVLNLFAQLIFLFLLILLGNGWAITRNEIPHKRALVALVSVFFVLYLTMFIWENVGIDAASTVYIYETAPGVIITVLRVLVLLWFLWSLRSSHMEENHPNKRQFYVVFGIAYTVWFLMLPFIVILAVAFPAWYRFKVVTGMMLTVDCLAMFGLAFLLWPTRATEYFQITKADMLLGAKTSPYERL